MLDAMKAYHVTRFRKGPEGMEIEMLHHPALEPVATGASFRDMTGIDPETDPKLAALVVGFASKVIESADDDDRYAD